MTESQVLTLIRPDSSSFVRPSSADTGWVPTPTKTIAMTTAHAHLLNHARIVRLLLPAAALRPRAPVTYEVKRTKRISLHDSLLEWSVR